jgi:apolipoprotein N-acyltransferase
MRKLPGAPLDFLLAALSAALLIVIFPGFGLTFLAPFTLAPLLIALGREPRPGRRFLLGYTTGVIYWFGVCMWIQFVLEVHGGMGRWGGSAVFVLFCLAKAVHLGVFAMLAAIVLRCWYAIPVVAALWVAIERTHGPLGFAWLALGNAGIDMALPMRLAPWTGVYGLSFLFSLLSAATAIVILRRGRKQLLWLALVPALFLLPELPVPAEPSETAVLVQPKIPEEAEWSPVTAHMLHQRIELLTLEAALAAKPQLIVWPEVPGPIYYYRDPQLRDEVTNLALTTRAWFLFGTVANTPQGGPLNSAVLLAPDGSLVDRYDKINLVPFGEFVPKFFGFVNRITQEAGDFVPGDRMVVFPMGEHKIGSFICYESVFPPQVRGFVHQGADLLVNISNDGYFGHSAAREQHLSIVRMRAAENRRWILRATNDGITASIDPTGHVRQSLPLYSELARKFDYGYVKELTPYTLYGDWFAWGCWIVVAAGLFASQWPHYNGDTVARRKNGTLAQTQ